MYKIYFPKAPETGFLRVYFPMKISVKKSVLDYTWLSMVAEMGGYVGLLLGVSLVDLAFSLDGIQILWARLTKGGKSKSKT